MIEDLRDLLAEFWRKMVRSRLVILGVVYVFMVILLCTRLFTLQIVNGQQAQDAYIQKTKKTITTNGTRGNIYDADGNLLAYNKIAYSVTITDDGYYKKANDKNLMYYRLVQILHKHNEKITGDFLIAVNDQDEFVYTATSNLAHKSFLRDVYGLKLITDLDDAKGKYPSDISAPDLVQNRMEYYKLDKLTDSEGNPVSMTKQEQLDMLNIRFAVGQKAFRRFEPTKIAVDIGEETKVDIMENISTLMGVDVEDDTLRVYSDPLYFSNILGYTGKVSDEMLEELQEKNPDYTSNDIVGRTGIEEYMETTLQGKKGSKTMVVDHVGHIMETVSEIESQSGNNVYLTIRKDLQIGIYHLIEQQLAGVLASKLVNEDNPNTEKTDATKRLIPIKDAYFQLINNSVLNMEHFKAGDATGVEQEIYRKLVSQKESGLAQVEGELRSPGPAPMGALSSDLYAYMYYVFTLLSSQETGIIDSGKLNTTASYYQRWKADEISLREMLFTGISEGWINTDPFFTEGDYSNADDIYNNLVQYVLDTLKTDPEFEKLVYKYLIQNNVLTGRELCLALFDQGVLREDPTAYALLTNNGEAYAYTFFVDKVSRIEISPAQLALDPCTAGVVVTDVRTGEIRALVSYPGYDNNRLANSMDVGYFNSLLRDQSLPLYNNATQTKKAPGSTFKPITAIASLEEGVVAPEERIYCSGEYESPSQTIKCWIYPNRHGKLNIIDGIKNSCNVYFSEMGHRLSSDTSTGEYNPNLGIERLTRFATMFGLNEKSGVELVENDPHISDINPEQSAIGQGNHSFTNVQLARYVTTIANQGTLFNLSLLDKVADRDGNVIEDFTPQVAKQIDIRPETWGYVKTGMREVIHSGSAKRIFYDLEVEIAGKTGTAQESKTRANHAFFISFAPYQNPEIAVSVNIPYGYSSANAATVAKNIYRLYFGYYTLEYVLSNGARDVMDVRIGD